MSLQTVIDEINSIAGQKIIMLIGLPGSGKSTLIKKLKEDLVSVGQEGLHVFSTDDLFVEEGKKLGLNYSQAFKQLDFKKVEAKARVLADEAAKRGKTIIMDQTNMTPARQGKMKMFGNLPKIAVVVTCDHELLQDRLDARSKTEGKTIPKFVVDNMRKSYVLPTIAEGFSKVLFYESIF